MFEKEEGKKKELFDKLNNEVLPQWLGFFEKRVGSNGFSVGDSLSIADLKFYGAFVGVIINSPFYVKTKKKTKFFFLT